MARVTLEVSGMTCDHCRGSVESALTAVSGVFGVYVDLGEAFAEVDFDENKTGPDALVEAVKTAGYEAKIAA
jgi:copper chaperone